MNILLISDPQVLSIPITESGEEMADLSGHPEISIDERKERPKEFYRVRRAVLAKLLEVHSSLPSGHRFLVIESWRPLSIQKKYFTEYVEELKSAHPEWDDKRIYDEASKHVAPPEIIPSHSTGGAIDLTLCDGRGSELDMGTRLNADPEESAGACFTNARNISDLARGNRSILIDVLSSVGFANYSTEWWHWSYGDRYWAYAMGQTTALYGSIDL
jgi:D-alanyl-D-alanine dipeptidase